MRRIVVIGTSGSGKTTLARELAERLGVDHIELDELHHGPGWTERDATTFRTLLADRLRATSDGWVICGNYRGKLGRAHWMEADTVVWLDLAHRVVMRSVVQRTIRRVVRREELWNGNREPLPGLWRRDGVVRWAWTSHAANGRNFAAAMQDPDLDHLDWVRLRSRREMRRWLASVSAADDVPSGGM